MEIRRLSGFFSSTLSALSRVDQIDGELLSYSTSAIKLALSIFPHEEIAFQIVLDAVLSVEKVAYEQKRSRMYSDVNKRIKILLEKVQLFQQIVYFESQKWEQYQETVFLLQYLRSCNQEICDKYQKDHHLSIEKLEMDLKINEIRFDNRLTELSELLKSISFNETDMIRRYLKFLIQQSICRNSFHVALAVSHLTYNYTLPEVIAICGILNPDLIDGTYLYKLKRKFLSSIKKRFSGFVSFIGNGNKQHLDICKDLSGELIEFVRESSCLLIPWGTKCQSEDTKLKNRAFDEQLFDWLAEIEDENQKEIYRVHTVICPSCYTNLVTRCPVKGRSTGVAKPLPYPVLAIPDFKIPGGEIDKQIPKIAINNPREESTEVIHRLTGSVKSESIRLAKALDSSKEIFIFVDGKKQGELKPAKCSSVRLNVDENARYIKVMLHKDGELSLLTSLVINFHNIEHSLLHRLFGLKKKYYTILKDGQRITIAITFPRIDLDDSDLVIDITYQDNSNKAVIRLLQSIKSKILELLNQYQLVSLTPVRVLIIIAIMACIVGFLYFDSLKRQSVSDQQAGELKQKQETNKQNAALPLQSKSQSSKPAPPDQRSQEPKNNPTRPQKQGNQNQNPPIAVKKPSNSNTMHSQGGANLSQVKRIYVYRFGDDSVNDLHGLLMESLASKGFDIVEQKEQADAVIRGSLIKSSDKQIIQVRLVNRPGRVLFAEKFVIDNDLESVASNITDHLLREKERKRKREKK
ncbi:MAG: hypothetical protein AB1489_13135 [Acidobacteriota bacterium]